MSFKEKYKKEIDGLSFSPDCEKVFTEAMKKTEKKSRIRIKNKGKAFCIPAAVIAVTVLLSAGTFAEPTQYSADATVADFQDSLTDFEDRWKASKKLPYEKGDEKYAFTVLGITSGAFLNHCDGFTADEGREYFVTAIRGRDGIDLTSENGGFPIKITPLVYGREPWETNSTTLCEDVRTAEKNGVIYYLFDTSFLDRFEGRIICFACYEGAAPTAEIFTMNEAGTVSFSEKYTGFGEIIEMPQDMSGTHPEIAEQILSKDELSKLY